MILRYNYIKNVFQGCLRLYKCAELKCFRSVGNQPHEENWDRFIQKDVSANIICLVEEQTDNEAVYSIERVELIKRKQYYSKFFRIISRLQRIINIRKMNIDLYRTLSNPHVVKAEGKAFSHTRVFLNPYPPY